MDYIVLYLTTYTSPNSKTVIRFLIQTRKVSFIRYINFHVKNTSMEVLTVNLYLVEKGLDYGVPT